MWRYFFRFGYARNIIEDPETTSRHYFNFVHAEGHLTPNFLETTPLIFTYDNVPPEAIDEIEGKYKEGITFIHSTLTAIAAASATRTFDLYKYENWETALVS